MTARAIEHDVLERPRPSAKVRTIARLLEVDDSHVRRLVDEGELEAHRIGKRGLRVYLESVRDWQERMARARGPAGGKRAIARSRTAATGAAHRNAEAQLRREGILS